MISKLPKRGLIQEVERHTLHDNLDEYLGTLVIFRVTEEDRWGVGNLSQERIYYDFMWLRPGGFIVKSEDEANKMFLRALLPFLPKQDK